MTVGSGVLHWASGAGEMALTNVPGGDLEVQWSERPLVGCGTRRRDALEGNPGRGEGARRCT